MNRRQSPPVTLVWFQYDLRLEDHPALTEAKRRGACIVPVFIWDNTEGTPWQPGEAGRWWLHHSLIALREKLVSAGSRLILRAGKIPATLHQLAKETHADSVYWNRCYDPSSRARETHLANFLRGNGIDTKSFHASLLFEPGKILNSQSKPYRVFSAYWKVCQTHPRPRLPLPVLRNIPAPPKWPRSAPLETLSILPSHPWHKKLNRYWKPGADGARKALRAFAKASLSQYENIRDFPCEAGTSLLSPHLRFGEISPHTVWHEIHSPNQPGHSTSHSKSRSRFLAEMGWREFAHYLLFHFPDTPVTPFQPRFKSFPWKSAPFLQKAWERGRTGIPIIDAGMRQLWETGWMHNRVRMITASFLTKNLLISWQEGARWFWDTLIDADLANNTLGWQWTAGCGADAAPYFRIFNPVLQAKKFDPKGTYIRKWVPELAQFTAKEIHHPWDATHPPLETAYPSPIIDLRQSRNRALRVYKDLPSSQPKPKKQ